ncbi:hypothetical protein WA026_019681 [Henosepilachna vigintioctopunctata]|uniref:Major facilitator superfamily (MFS) profile domain-containing protein n=1 Tax=Henosepilachna vigintioctopunctata TaxID=420089 RepID=A0AAW1URM9_9CUCU
MECSRKKSISKSDDTLKLYGYRWVVITVFALYCTINIAQFSQFTILMDIVEKYYGVSLATANMSGEIFMILNILLFIPTGELVERCSLKTSSIICTGLTALGNCMKFLACSPDRYFMVLITQSICAVAQNIALILPSKLACAWFGPEEVSLACSIGLFGNQIGSALGSVVPTLIVKDHEDLDLITDDFNTLFIYNSGISVAFFVLTVLFFRSKPPLHQVSLSLNSSR